MSRLTEVGAIAGLASTQRRALTSIFDHCECAHVRSTGLLKLPIFMFSSVRALRALDGAKEIEARSIAKPFAQSFGRNQMRKATATSARAGARSIWVVTAFAQNARWALMWSAFQCATSAEMSGGAKENERLFGIGLKAGRQFVEAVKNGQISPEAMQVGSSDWCDHVPRWAERGFYHWESIRGRMGDVYDDIVKRRNGIPLPSSDWVMDEAIRKPEEKHRYVKGQL